MSDSQLIGRRLLLSHDNNFLWQQRRVFTKGINTNPELFTDRLAEAKLAHIACWASIHEVGREIRSRGITQWAHALLKEAYAEIGPTMMMPGNELRLGRGEKVTIESQLAMGSVAVPGIQLVHSAPETETGSGMRPVELAAVA